MRDKWERVRADKCPDRVEAEQSWKSTLEKGVCFLGKPQWCSWGQSLTFPTPATKFSPRPSLPLGSWEDLPELEAPQGSES